MNFEERFAKWKQDGREFRSAFRDVIVAVERKREPDATQENLETKANHLMYDLLEWSPEEGDHGFHYGLSKEYGQGSDSQVDWGKLFGRGMSKPHLMFVPSDVHIPPDPELKSIPNAPHERAVVANELWQMLVADNEIGQTNAQVELRFGMLQEKHYGRQFLRVKVEGLHVSVQHLNDRGEWVTL